MCELYKDTHITIRINEKIYYGPIKIMWQTFHDKPIEVFYKGNWFPAKIIGNASEKELIKITDKFICSKDLILKTPIGNRKISDAFDDDFIISINRHKCGAILSSEDIVHIGRIGDMILDEKSDWLFGIEFMDSDNQYYTLTDGFIISVK